MAKKTKSKVEKYSVYFREKGTKRWNRDGTSYPRNEAESMLKDWKKTTKKSHMSHYEVMMKQVKR